MSTAYLGLGSNVDAPLHIRAAVHALRENFSRVELSMAYRSRAVGFEGEDFINLVAGVETSLPAGELREYLRKLEDRHGRQRNVPKYSDRTLDIDILLYDDLVISTGQLELPRPEILRFAHVLRPLADLAPERVHPVNGQTFAALWAQAACRDVALEPLDPAFLDDD